MIDAIPNHRGGGAGLYFSKRTWLVYLSFNFRSFPATLQAWSLPSWEALRCTVPSSLSNFATRRGAGLAVPASVCFETVVSPWHGGRFPARMGLLWFICLNTISRKENFLRCQKRCFHFKDVAGFAAVFVHDVASPLSSLDGELART